MLAFAKYIIQNYLERVSLETLAGFGLIFSSARSFLSEPTGIKNYNTIIINCILKVLLYSIRSITFLFLLGRMRMHSVVPE